MNIEKLLFNKSFESKNRKLVDHVRSLSGRQKKQKLKLIISNAWIIDSNIRLLLDIHTYNVRNSTFENSRQEGAHLFGANPLAP